MIRQTIKKLIAKIIGNEPQTQTSNVFVAETQNIVQNNSGTINYNNVSSKTDDVDKSSKKSKVYMFTIATIINVVVNTIRSIVTIKGNKWSAAFWNAVCYGFYTYIVILTAGDGIPTWQKMMITGIANFACVFIIKWVEEKRKAIKLWKVELTIPKGKTEDFNK